MKKENKDCYCVCNMSISSNAYCEHCKGDNEVGRHHKDKKNVAQDKQWNLIQQDKKEKTLGKLNPRRWKQCS